MRVDDIGVRMRLKQGLGDLPALVAGEVARLRGNDLETPGRLDRFVEALLAVIGGGRAGRALKLDDIRLAVCGIDQPQGNTLY